MTAADLAPREFDRPGDTVHIEPAPGPVAVLLAEARALELRVLADDLEASGAATDATVEAIRARAARIKAGTP